MHHLRRFIPNIVCRERRKFYNQQPLQQPLHQPFQQTFQQPFSKQRYRCFCTIEAPPERIEFVETLTTIPKGSMGQPTCYTHPHMINQDDLTCGITQAEYRQRRATLVSKLVGEVENMHSTHIVVIPAACKQYMSEKIPYVFRQNSDFFYLTGCMEPSAVLVLMKPAQIDDYKSILFVHEKDNHAELWEGPRTGCAAAHSLFTVDETRPVETFGSFLSKMASTSGTSVLWYHSETPPNPDLHTTICGTMRGEGCNVTLADPQKTLHFMRVVKSRAELELMKETCIIGAQAMNMAMACTKPGVSEHMVSAILEYTSKQGGADHLAFPPVVAGGPRATHIHYVANNQILKPEEMLLVDSGSQFWLYNSDISRTFPVSGKFTKHHRILYELVLTVQKRLIEILGEHRPPLDQLFNSMCRLLGVHLQQEGILPKNIDGNELVNRAYRLCPHHVSHYIGLDVHDSSLVRRNVPVCPNMVVTVEPGIYIRPDDTSVPSEFRGIGIRVEDDVLITEGEPIVLSADAAKEVPDIEALVGTQEL